MYDYIKELYSYDHTVLQEYTTPTTDMHPIPPQTPISTTSNAEYDEFGAGNRIARDRAGTMPSLVLARVSRRVQFQRRSEETSVWMLGDELAVNSRLSLLAVATLLDSTFCATRFLRILQKRLTDVCSTNMYLPY